MKIIGIDNYNRESVSDFLVCENIKPHFGKQIVDFLNKDAEHSSIFYRLVEDDHKLYKFEP